MVTGQLPGKKKWELTEAKGENLDLKTQLPGVWHFCPSANKGVRAHSVAIVPH